MVNNVCVMDSEAAAHISHQSFNLDLIYLKELNDSI